MYLHLIVNEGVYREGVSLNKSELYLIFLFFATRSASAHAPVSPRWLLLSVTEMMPSLFARALHSAMQPGGCKWREQRANAC